MTDEQQDEQFYRDTEGVAFPKLNDHQLSLLEPLGERRLVERGDLVYKAGQRDLGLTILLRGEIEVHWRRGDAAGHVSPSVGKGNITRCRDTLYSRGGNAPSAGRDPRSQQDDRRCANHATAANKTGPGICRNACSG